METPEKKFFGLDINSKTTPYKLVGLVVVLWGGCWVLVPLMYKTPDGSGTFGDMFGAVNALFSGLAFVGLIYTILLQREDLRLTREELRGQKEEFQIQNMTLKRQRFESMFFNLLTAHQTLLPSLYTRSWEGDVIRGRDLFQHITARITNELQHDSSQSRESLLNRYKVIYHKKVFEASIKALDPYIYSINSILSFIDNSELSSDTIKSYYNIIYSLLTPDEKTVLLYHSKLGAVTDEKIRDRLWEIFEENDFDLVDYRHIWLFSASEPNQYV